MQVQLSITSVGKSGSGYNIIVNLQCWPNAVVTDEANKVIDKDFSGYIKGNVEGLTKADLILRALSEMETEAKMEIEKYVSEQSIVTDAALATELTAIENRLSKL